MKVRQARERDYDAVAAFTADTWDRYDGDYIPSVFEEWVETDDETQHTLVAVEDETPIGLVQTVLLSPYEAWFQGMRVDPEHRDKGVGLELAHASFEWASERGATIGRNMVFSWNVQGLGLSRASGFEPEAEFRWAHPDPDPDAEPGVTVTENRNAAWSYWQRSSARDALRGLGLHMGESWAVSEVTPERLEQVRDEESLIVLEDEGTVGMTYRVRVYEREREGEEQTWAEYGAAAWDDPDACRDLMAAIARDAASVDAEFVRVLIPERPAPVSDVSLHRVELAEDPDFVMAVDLTRPDWDEG